MSKIAEALEARLSRFAKFLEVIRGKEDAKLRPNMILRPENKLTSSNLSELQVDFVTNSYFIAKHFAEFQPMADYAEIYLQTNESKSGWGVDKVIEYEQALGEKRMMQLGLRPGQQQGQGKEGKEVKEKDVK